VNNVAPSGWDVAVWWLLSLARPGADNVAGATPTPYPMNFRTTSMFALIVGGLVSGCGGSGSTSTGTTSRHTRTVTAGAGLATCVRAWDSPVNKSLTMSSSGSLFGEANGGVASIQIDPATDGCVVTFQNAVNQSWYQVAYVPATVDTPYAVASSEGGGTEVMGLGTQNVVECPKGGLAGFGVTCAASPAPSAPTVSAGGSSSTSTPDSTAASTASALPRSIVAAENALGGAAGDLSGLLISNFGYGTAPGVADITAAIPAVQDGLQTKQTPGPITIRALSASRVSYSLTVGVGSDRYTLAVVVSPTSVSGGVFTCTPVGAACPSRGGRIEVIHGSWNYEWSSGVESTVPATLKWKSS